MPPCTGVYIHTYVRTAWVDVGHQKGSGSSLRVWYAIGEWLTGCPLGHGPLGPPPSRANCIHHGLKEKSEAVKQRMKLCPGLVLYFGGQQDLDPGG
jgi:hypothetical protein